MRLASWGCLAKKQLLNAVARDNQFLLLFDYNKKRREPVRKGARVEVYTCKAASMQVCKGTRKNCATVNLQVLKGASVHLKEQVCKGTSQQVYSW